MLGQVRRLGSKVVDGVAVTPYLGNANSVKPELSKCPSLNSLSAGGLNTERVGRKISEKFLLARRLLAWFHIVPRECEPRLDLSICLAGCRPGRLSTYSS